MFRTPLKNTKNVNKPFKSPLESPINKDLKASDNTNNLKKGCETPVLSFKSKRNLEAKRVLLLDEDENEKKKQKIIPFDANLQNVSVENLSKNDLLVLKRKIFELRQEVDCLKSREQCVKKHDPRDLKNSIHKWKEACQNALENICSELTERNGQSTKISEVLKMLNIPESIVYYSEKDDGFI